MHWSGEAIIINKIKYSESSLIVTFFSGELGLFKAIIKGARKLKNSNLSIEGNIVRVNFYRRSPDKLAIANLELVKSFYGSFYANKFKLLLLKTIISMLNIFMSEGEENQEFYLYNEKFLYFILNENINLYHYLEYELRLLQEIGIGLNLSKCVVSGKTSDLYYISPKTGNIVCRVVGEKYHDKLLIMSQYLLTYDKQYFNQDDLKLGKKTLEYFFENFFLTEVNKKLPHVRDLLFNEPLIAN